MCARRRPAAIAKDTSGAAAVELALISPVLVMLLIGVIQLGWTLHCAASVRWALEGASRAVMLDPTLSAGEVQTAMLAKLSGVADASSLNVTLSPSQAGDSVVVQSRYIASLSVPFVPAKSMTFDSQVTVPRVVQ